MGALSRPLFLVGTGRCGSTVLHEMLAHHEDLAYLTHLLDRHPDRPRVNAWLMGRRDRAAQRRLLRWRVEPSEAWSFWEHWVPGFAEPCRDLAARDAGPRVRSRVHRALEAARGRDELRLLVKFTGWPRLRWILEAFPDARIVHVVRDPRAVSNSMLNVSWWQGWSGPGNWSFGPLTEAESRLWDEVERDFAALACIEWCRLVRAWRSACEDLVPQAADQLLEIRYDELCADRDGALRRILTFAGLDWRRDFEDRLAAYRIESRDSKWRKDLSESSQEAMAEVLERLRWRELYPEDEVFPASSSR